MYYEVFVGSKYYHGIEPLTYQSNELLKSGHAVRIPLRNRTCLGIIFQQVPKPDFKCSSITEVLPFTIPEAHVRLLDWMRGYYPAPLGTIVDLFLPKLPKKVGPVTSLAQAGTSLNYILPKLTTNQAIALKTLVSSHSPVILHGKTGSGKTRVYIEAALQTLRAGRSVIILAPEIGLSKHLEKRLLEVLPPEQLFVLHSHLTERKRRDAWRHIQAAQFPLVITGARSALFAPLKNIGLIVLDEFHDSAYKQEQLPNYQTSRVAARLANLSNASLIYGSATPPISDYAAFQKKRLPILEMNDSALTSQPSKVVEQFVDLSDTTQFTRSSHISQVLVESIKQSLADDEQSLVFLNRRGTARLIACENCGWRATCPDCDIGQTYHGDKNRLICHSCGLQQPLPAQCPECGGHELVYTVAGTKTLEAELTKLFPQARIHRLDRDTAPENRIERVFDDIEMGKIDIIVGTQSVVKGFDLKNLSTVGVIYADASLQIADYLATERTYQLISQVAGRLGRGHRDGRLVIQTYHPKSDLFKWALAGNYEKLLEQELKTREKYNFPPYSYILKITARRASGPAAEKALKELKERLPEHKDLEIGRPAPSYPERISGKYRWHIIIKSKKRQNLVQIIMQLPKNYSYDIDPNTLL